MLTMGRGLVACFFVVNALLWGAIQAEAVPVSTLNGLSGWTGSYTDTDYNLLDDTAANVSHHTSVSSSSATLFTQGINSGVFMSTIATDVDFDMRGTIRFDLSMSLADTLDGRASTYDQTIRDFLSFSFFGTDSSFSQLDSHNTFTLGSAPGTIDFGTIMCDVSSLYGSSGSLYFDLLDMDDGFYSSATISNLAFVPEQVAPVPEPSTVVLLAVGLGFIGIRLRRR